MQDDVEERVDANTFGKTSGGVLSTACNMLRCRVATTGRETLATHWPATLRTAVPRHPEGDNPLKKYFSGTETIHLHAQQLFGVTNLEPGGCVRQQQSPQVVLQSTKKGAELPPREQHGAGDLLTVLICALLRLLLRLFPCHYQKSVVWRLCTCLSFVVPSLMEVPLWGVFSQHRKHPSFMLRLKYPLLKQLP